MADERADVVIIGDGIAGVSLAYFLAEAGVTNFIVLAWIARQERARIQERVQGPVLPERVRRDGVSVVLA